MIDSRIDAAASGAACGTDTATAVSLRSVVFRYPKAAGDALSIERFDVRAGERVFVRGPSGSGKTTLLSIVAGVLAPTSGSASLHGQDWAALSPARRDRARADRIGYVFQQFNLLGYLSVVENVLLPCRFSPQRRKRAGGTPGSMMREATQLLQRMGLDGSLTRRHASQLSVGQQQRVAAARALIGQPGLVIADEPTSALDENARESFMKVLLDACSEAGSALVFVSHDARLAPLFTRSVDLAIINRATVVVNEEAA